MGGVLGLVGLEDALSHGNVVRVGGAAKPDVGRGVAVLLLDLGLDLARREALVGGLNAKELLEVLRTGSHVLLLAGAVDHELAVLLGGLDQAGIGAAGARRTRVASACRKPKARCCNSGCTKELPARYVLHGTPQSNGPSQGPLRYAVAYRGSPYAPGQHSLGLFINLYTSRLFFLQNSIIEREHAPQRHDRAVSGA